MIDLKRVSEADDARKPVPVRERVTKAARTHPRRRLAAGQNRGTTRRSALSPSSVKPNHVDSTKYPPTQIAGIWYSARKTGREGTAVSKRAIGRRRKRERERMNKRKGEKQTDESRWRKR